jgi:glycosyltransferase involved in cell wall biosynthesis
MTALVPGRAPGMPRLHITPDPRHGVTLYAQRLADVLTARHASAEPTDEAATDAERHSQGHTERVHAHFTDRLWGLDPASAAEAVERLAQRASVTVTLHDLPQASDGARNLPRRAAAYARVVAAASGVVCNSRHEAALLQRFVGAETTAVIPLPVDPQPDGPAGAGAGARRAVGAVGVLGYIYPGKGHHRVLRAVGGLRRWPLPVVEALGRASDGHERDLESLRRTARYSGVALQVTGFLSEAAMLERCRRTAVPVIAHQHVSASGSLASWLAAGRRPLVLRSPYMEEMAELHRDALTLVDARSLGEAIEHALVHPESTWLGEEAQLGPTTRQVAERYRAFWGGVAW